MNSDCLLNQLKLHNSKKFFWFASELREFIMGDASKNAETFIRDMKNRYSDISPIKTLTSTRAMNSYLQRFIKMMTKSGDFYLLPECESDVLEKLVNLAKKTLQEEPGLSSTIRLLLYYIICNGCVNMLTPEPGLDDADYDYTYELHRSGMMIPFKKLTALIDAYSFEDELRRSAYAKPLTMKALEHIPEYYAEMLLERRNETPEAEIDFEQFKLRVNTAIHKALKMDSYKKDLPIKFSTNPYGDNGLIKKLSSIGFGNPDDLYEAFFGKHNPDVNFDLSKLTISATENTVTFDFTLTNYRNKHIGDIGRTFSWDKRYVNLDYAVIEAGFQTKKVYKNLLELQLTNFTRLGFREIRMHVSGGIGSVAFAEMGFDFVDRNAAMKDIVKSFSAKRKEFNVSDAYFNSILAKVFNTTSAKELSKLTLPSKIPELMDLGAYLLIDTEWDARLVR